MPGKTRRWSLVAVCAALGVASGVSLVWFMREQPHPPGSSVLDNGLRSPMPVVVIGPPLWVYLLITFTFAINDAWSDDVTEGSTITINVSAPGSQDAQTLVHGLESLDDAIVALDGTNQIGDAQFSIARGGALLGLIETDGITFPALGVEADAAFVGDLKTPRQISVAAQEKQPIILVENGVVADSGE